MRRVRSIVSFGIGLLAIVWAFSTARGTEAAGAAPAATAGIPVEIEDGTGQKSRGTFAGALQIHTDYGLLELDPKKVMHIGIVPAESGGFTVSVQLEDETHLNGKLVSETIPVSVNHTPGPLQPKDVQGITFLHPKDHSLLAAGIGLLTLTFMEIVLGVDNIIFLAIVAGKLPEPQQPKARRIGLIAALGSRLILLFFLTWVLGLTKPVYTLPDMPLFHTLDARAISWRDIILLAGGTFLIGKSVLEMHEKIEHAKEASHRAKPASQTGSFAGVIAQIAVIDIIFSLDSVVTAVGMVDELWVMVVAMLIAVGVMMVAADPIGRFVERHPTIKVLALSFLILIGVLLVAEGLGQHLDKGYIYFAMAFGVGVEMVNMQLRGSPTRTVITNEPSSGTPA